jgi:cold shock protein
MIRGEPAGPSGPTPKKSRAPRPKLRYDGKGVHPMALARARQSVFAENKKSRDMATGTVKWFNDAKGFGFITQDGGGEDVFCHQSVIQQQGFRSVSEGQRVEFDIKQGPKGLQADKVRVIA